MTTTRRRGTEAVTTGIHLSGRDGDASYEEAQGASILKAEPVQPGGRDVLVVEDDAPIRDLLCFHLTHGGFNCVEVSDGLEALRLATKQPFSLIVLDLTLPRVDGLTVCRRLRNEGVNQDVPILVLTARGQESDKVLGLQSGADDYLTKPFGIAEFMARASVLVRRKRPATEPVGARTKGAVVTANGVEIDPTRHTVICRGLRVSLTPQEFDLLYLLASHPGIVYGRDEILKNVWHHHTFVTDRSISTLVKRLRRKIERDSLDPELIVTVWGIGYKFGK